MLNYIKSEFYRFSRNRALYMTVAVFSGLILVFNLILYYFATYTGGFHYGITSFSFSMLAGSPIMYCYMALVMGAILYEADKKSGGIKNTIAFGISRTKIFAGKCIVGLVISTIAMVFILAVYVISALVLLEHRGPVTAGDMMMEVVAVFPIAVAALILGIVVMDIFDRTAVGIVVWIMIFSGVPTVLFYLSIKIKALYEIVMWMPSIFFKTGV